MALNLHRCDRPDALADALAHLLERFPPDVFDEEIIVVPARGIERWLTQRLSHTLGRSLGDDGVCAGLKVLTPTSLMSLVLGREHDDVWHADRLAWPTLTAIDNCATQPGFETLGRHIGAIPTSTDAPDVAVARQRTRTARRYATARRVAGLFASYANERPTMLAEWQEGRESDGFDRPLAPDLLWQPPLWRETVRRVGEAAVQQSTSIGSPGSELNVELGVDPGTEPAVEPGIESPVDRHFRICRELRESYSASSLPPRLSLFGHTRLTTAQIDILAALSVHRDVHLWLPHPSPQLWQDLQSQACSPRPLREDDHSSQVARHPLLRTLGRDVRELELALLGGAEAAGLNETAQSLSDEALSTPAVEDDVSVRPSLLHDLQADIRANRDSCPQSNGNRDPLAANESDGSPDADSERKRHGTDTSIQLHACHGPARQVEALRELLVWLLNEDAGDTGKRGLGALGAQSGPAGRHSGNGLQPRDILVMCPDLETFAPLIHAAFAHPLSGSQTSSAPRDSSTIHAEAESAPHPGSELRVQIADRSLAALNPLIDLAQRILELVAGRFTAPEIIDFAGHESVARQFGFSEQDLETLSAWVTESGVRWGLDSTHRGEYGLRGLDANTWHVALERMALGAVISPDSNVAAREMVPLTDVDSTRLKTLGAFLEMMARLARAATRVRQAHTISDWSEVLTEAVLSLGACSPDAMWQQTAFQRAVKALSDSADDGAQLRLTDIKVLVKGRWGSTPSRSNFRTGAVSVCSMVPMRSVPHKAIIWLGVDDGAYPRAAVTDGDDVLLRHPRIGERDPRSEDAELLLDALMAAQDYFIAIYSGFDEHSGTRRPPAAPIQELLMALPAAEAENVIHVHPLQSFDPRNFTLNSPVQGGSFDQHALAGARAWQASTQTQPRSNAIVAGPLEVPPHEPVVALSDLTAFMQNPAREFLRRRLEIAVAHEPNELSDRIPLGLDSLELWQVGDRVLTSAVAGVSLDAAVRDEIRRGALPPGALAEVEVAKIKQAVESIVGDRAGCVTSNLEVDLPIDAETRVVGQIAHIVDSQATSDLPSTDIETFTYSTISAKQLGTTWPQLLALCVARPDGPHRAILHGKPGRSSLGNQESGVAVLQGPPADEALSLLRKIVDARRSGLRYPLSIPPKTALRYQVDASNAMRRGKSASQAHELGLNAAAKEWLGSKKYPGESADVYWRTALGAADDMETLTTSGAFSYWAPHIWQPIWDHLESR